MNNQSLDAIAENWYARLNRLKARYSIGGLEPKKEEQIKRMIVTMIIRMTKITPLYVEAKYKNMVTKTTSFKPGGVAHK